MKRRGPHLRGLLTGHLVVLVAMVLTTPGPPHAAESDFTTWLEGVRVDALDRGVRAITLEAALTGVAPIPRVIELDRRQPEFTLTFGKYLDRVIPERRVRRGRDLLAKHRGLLDEIAEAYGVQPRFIVALWGIESDFGRITGGFDVVSALATLAFDGRRSAYFRAQLLDALVILDQGHIAPRDMVGSWAGAMGQSQFMPSSFIHFAVDHDGDGRRDIWTTPADVFASTANYLAKSGWRDDITWGREVRLPVRFDRSLIGAKVVKQLPAWQALGVRRTDGSDLPARPLAASLIEPEEGRGAAFLVYDNHRAILRWNRSTYFALAVGLLADRIADR